MMKALFLYNNYALKKGMKRIIKYILKQLDIPVILTPQSGDVDPLIGLGSSNLND
jgi:hypothetical protein